MKIVFLLCLTLLANSALAAKRTESSKIYGSLSDEGRLILVPYGNDDEYLAYFAEFDNFDNPVAKLYRKEKSGGGGDGHYFRLVGTDTINIQSQGSVLLHGSLVPYIEVIDEAGEKTKMVFIEKAGAFEADKAAAQYQKYQNIAPSFIEAKKAIAAGQAQVQAACGGTLKVNIDWNAFEAKESKPVPGMLKGHLDALARICEADTDYKKAVAAIKEIRLTEDAAPRSHTVKVANGVITVSLHAEAVNVPDTAYAKFQEAL